MKEKAIYIEFYNADTGEMEWRKFNTTEVDDLFRLGILDTDSLGYYMDDAKAFDETILAMAESKRSWTYGELVDYYLDHTENEIRIRG